MNFIANTEDDLRCYQAAMRMAWERAGIGDPGQDEADRLTGYLPGLQTWAFEGMLATANRGFAVLNVEDFDASAFVNDPRSEILRQSDNDTEIVDHVYKVSDVERQRAVVAECLEHELITFERRIPSWEDLIRSVETSGAVVSNVNARAIAGNDGYNGHFVLIDAVEGGASGSVRIQDPGLPPRADVWITKEEFLKAWSEPSPRLANIIAISPGASPVDGQTVPGQ